MMEMKQTGIRWIGEIPAEWNTKRIKYMASLKGRIGWQGLTSDEYQDEGAYLITGVDFLDGGINWEQCEHVPMKRWEEARDIQIQNGDLLITKDGTVGKVAIVSNMPGETSLNSGVLRIIPVEGYSRRFLYWVLQSEVFWNWFNFKNAGNSTIVHLYQGDFSEFVYAYPRIDEQELIADYLNKECGILDEIIETVEKQIEYLVNYRRSLIIEATTKGLNEHAEMVPSGNVQIGDMPAHWSVLRGKYIFNEFGGSIKDEDLTDDANEGWKKILYFKVDDMNRTEYGFEMKYDTDDLFTRKSYREFKAPLILIPKRGAAIYTNKVRITNKDCFIDPNVMAISVKGNIEFYAYYLFGRTLADIGDVSTIPQINNKHIDNLLVPVPPKDEQDEIVEYLNKKNKAIDELLDDKRKQLEILREQRKSTIYELVTGKKRIKEVMKHAN